MGLLPHIKKLDDALGQFLVQITCRCGASPECEAAALAVSPDRQRRSRRLRRACDARSVEPREQRRSLRRLDTGNHDINVELIFLHFRKALEGIAFASLAANRARYEQARAGFATEWNARRMLGFVERVNPNFYPVPLTPPERVAPKRVQYGRSHD